MKIQNIDWSEGSVEQVVGAVAFRASAYAAAGCLLIGSVSKTFGGDPKLAAGAFVAGGLLTLAALGHGLALSRRRADDLRIPIDLMTAEPVEREFTGVR